MARPKFRKNYDEKNRADYQTEIIGESMTEQSHKDQCDVNLIIKQYERTGLITHLTSVKAEYGDVDAIELQQALELVKNADIAFMDLPSQLRKHFDNDAVEFLRRFDEMSDDDREVFAQYGFADSPPPPSDPGRETREPDSTHDSTPEQAES